MEKEKSESDKEIKNEEVPIENNKVCDHCGKENKASNAFCNFCGHHFFELIKCKNCQNEVPIFNTFCSFCGSLIRFPSQDIEKLRQQKDLPTTTYQVMQNDQIVPINKLPLDIQKQIYENQQISHIQSRLNAAKIVGIVFICLGILNFIWFIVALALYSTPLFKDLYEEMYGSLVGFNAIIGSLIANNFPIILVFITSGISLIKYRPNNKPWKGLYSILRFIFIGFTSLLGLVIIIVSASWIFYNPSIKVIDDFPLWFFSMLKIPVNININYLYLILFACYTLCIILLILPAIVSVVKSKTKIENNGNIEGSKIDYKVNDKSKEITDKNLFIDLKTRTELLKEVESRKGLMPNIFHRIKRTPLIGTIELLAASQLVSFVIIFILMPFINEDPGIEQDPFITVALVTWAGIFEELSFRLLIIGIPMIFVVIIRMVFFKSEEKLTYKDVLLAFRGKYRIIGYPEWGLIVISSLLFGFAHWELWTGSWGAWKIFQASIAGLFLSYAFVKYGIESAIFIHITNNLIAAISVYSTEIAGAGWLGGISYFITNLLLIVGLMKIISVIINLVYRYHIIKLPKPGY